MFHTPQGNSSPSSTQGTASPNIRQFSKDEEGRRGRMLDLVSVLRRWVSRYRGAVKGQHSWIKIVFAFAEMAGISMGTWIMNFGGNNCAVMKFRRSSSCRVIFLVHGYGGHMVHVGFITRGGGLSYNMMTGGNTYALMKQRSVAFSGKIFCWWSGIIRAVLLFGLRYGGFYPQIAVHLGDQGMQAKVNAAALGVNGSFEGLREI
jgi:hypothetical protein